MTAAGATPMEGVDCARLARTLDHQLEGVRSKTGRVRYHRRLKQARAFGYIGDLLNAVLAIVQVQVAFERILNLVAGIDVKFATVFTASSDKGQRIFVKPQLVCALAGFCQVPHDLFKIDVGHLKAFCNKHRVLLSMALKAELYASMLSYAA